MKNPRVEKAQQELLEKGDDEKLAGELEQVILHGMRNARINTAEDPSPEDLRLDLWTGDGVYNHERETLGLYVRPGLLLVFDITDEWPFIKEQEE